MRNLVVLLDIHCLHTAETGIRKYVENFIDILSEQNNSRHKYVMSPTLPSINKRWNYRRRRVTLFRVVYHLETFLWKQVILPWKAWRINADIIFSPDYFAPMWRTSAHKVVVFHDTFFWDNPEHYGRLWLLYFRRMCLLGLKRKGSVLTISEFSMSKVRQVVPSNINVDFQYHAFRGLRTRVSTDIDVIRVLNLGEKKFFLHVGVFEKRKNIQILLKAFSIFLDGRRSDEYRLVLVGKRPISNGLDDYDAMMDLIEELKLQETVLLPGYLPDAQIKALLMNALAYIFPSTNEGFGMPILEAFEMECPIITSDQPALVEVGSIGALSFPRCNPGALSDLMIQLDEDNVFRKVLIGNGKERLKDFGRDLYFQNMENYFNRVCSKE